MLRTVRLYGRLKKQFGPSFQFEASTPAEMVRALCVLVPGFAETLREGCYRFVRGDRHHGHAVMMPTFDLGLGGCRELHLIPSAKMSKSGFGKILLGAVMIGAAFATGGASLIHTATLSGGLFGSFTFGTSLALTGVMGFVAKLGFMMILGGISMLLTPKPKSHNSSTDKNESFLFSGAQNTAQQGAPVPLIYGKKVRVGSVVVSVGLDAEQIAYTPAGHLATVGIGSGRIGDLVGLAFAKGGKSGSGGTTGQESPNTLQSNATARIVDLLGEGVIGGLTNGLKSVFFDDVPVQNNDGSFNFKGVQIESRVGNPSDTPILGFSDAENEVSFSTKVTTSTPLVKAVVDTNVTSVRLKIGVNSLISVDDKGNINGTDVAYAIDVQPNGGAYAQVMTDTISGKTNTAYQRALRIPLNGTGPWNIRMRRLTADSTDTKLQNDIFWQGYTEITEARLMYPNSALIALTADAQQFGSSIPNRSYEVGGLQIKVPQNYDPDTRSYATSGPGTSGGVWDGTFKVAVTDNPAWILYDILTNNRYGLGQFIPSNYPNKWVLYEIAQHCDALVPDGNGGTEPRYTINTQIVDRGEAWNLLLSIVSVFRGMFYWGSGAIEFSYDHDSTPAKLVTPANVIDGRINYSSDTYSARHSVVIVSWNDPELGGRPNYEVVEDADLIAKYGYKQIETTAWGCTSRGQARRVGLWILETEKNGELINYSAGLDHSDLRPGQIIEVNDPEFTTSRMAGRLVSGSTTTTLKLDAPVTLPAGETYSVKTVLSDGTVISRPVTTGAGTTSDLTVSPALPSVPIDGSIWSVSTSSYTPRTFMVLGVEEQEGLQFSVTGIYHDPNKYARVEQGLDLPPNDFSNLKTGQLACPPDIHLGDFFFREGNAAMPGALISWPDPQDPRVTFFQWQLKRPGAAAWDTLNATVKLSDEIRNIQPGTYEARVRSCDYTGRKSPWTYRATNVLVGGEAALPDPTSLTANPDNAALTSVLRWAYTSTETRPVTFQIHWNSVNNFATAAFLGETTAREWVISRVGYYWVTAAFANITSNHVVKQVITTDLPVGASGFTGYLTNESHTIPANASSAVTSYAGAAGNFKVLYGTTDVTAACSFSVVSNPQGLTNGAAALIDGTGFYTVTGGLDAAEPNATVVFRATHPIYGPVDKTFSLGKSVSGATGATPPLITLNQDFYTFDYDTAGAIKARTVTFKATRNSAATAATTWTIRNRTGAAILTGVSTAGVVSTGYFSQTDADTLTMTHTQFTAFISGSPERESFTLEASSSGVTDKASITKVQDGAPGASAFHIGNITNANVSYSNDWTKNPAGSDAWDGSAKTIESFLGSASVTCDYATDIFVGLSTGWVYNPATEVSFSHFDYALHISSDGHTAVYRNGTLVSTLGLNQPGNKPIVWSDGRTIHYACGTLSYSHPVNATGERLYGVFALYHHGQTMTGIGFAAAGPAGSDGNWRDTKFIRSASAPPTPTGDDPVGWSDGIPPGTGTIWQIIADKTFAGTLIGTWSAPQSISGLTPRGAYSATDTYYLNNLVTFNGGTYSAVQSNFSNHPPSGTDQSNAYWDVYAAPGAPGAPATPPSAFSATINLTSGAAINLRSLADAAGYTGASNATITFNVPSGVVVRGAAFGGKGIDTGTWPSGYSIALTLNVQSGGIVDGGGGNGGDGGSGVGTGGAGGAGGDAIYCQTPITVNINAGGTVRGGGGGGGGGGGKKGGTSTEPFFYGGGGGGGGFPNGSAGIGYVDFDGGGSNGSGGTTSGGGSGGAGYSGSGDGGGGGGAATSGTSGTTATKAGGPAGAAGYAVRKNGNAVTVTNSGTMIGAAA